MEYIKPRLPEKEIELCLDLFDKKEAKKRILKYIEGIFNDAESQFKFNLKNKVVWNSKQLESYANFLERIPNFQNYSDKDLAIDYCDSL